VNKSSPFPMLTLPEIVGRTGLLTDGDWVESKDQDPSGAVRLTQLADVGDGEFRDRSDRWMNDEQASRLNVTMLKAGDVLIARMPDPLGRACVCPALPTRAVTVVDVCVVRAPGHNPKWLMYALNAPQMRSEIAKLQAGSTRKRISKANLSTIPIPVPTRTDQDRFVGVIETHFSRLDAAVASLTRAKANLKRARASVLKAAVEGRLVPTEAALARAEGREYEPASGLLARILAERKATWAASGARGKYAEPVQPETEGLPGLPEGWCWASVDAVTLVSGGITKNAGRAQRDQLVPYLRVANVYADELRLEDVSTIAVSDAELPRLLLHRGDLLIVEGNGSADQLGRVAVWNGSISPCIHQNHLIKARPLHGASERWLLHWMLSPGGRHAIQSVASSTSGLHTLSISKVQALPVVLSPLAEQQRIVAEVDRRLSVLDALDATVDNNLARCARLRQSILKLAFEGRLVSTGPIADTPLLAADAPAPSYDPDVAS
jgi:type I restriction enzyme S subunit